MVLNDKEAKIVDSEELCSLIAEESDTKGHGFKVKIKRSREDLKKNILLEVLVVGMHCVKMDGVLIKLHLVVPKICYPGTKVTRVPDKVFSSSTSFCTLNIIWKLYKDYFQFKFNLSSIYI